MKRPATDGELWDYVHRLFGIGDWDEDNAIPFWKYRATEVMKVKAKRNKLKASVEELTAAADYCKAMRIDIRNVAWLYQHLAGSRGWAAARQRTLMSAAFDELYDEAVEQAYGTEWADRLVRARGEYRQEVYDQWQATRTADSRR